MNLLNSFLDHSFTVIVLQEHDDDAYNAEMRLDPRLANALWIAKEYNESIKLFKQSFDDYPVKRRKISSTFRFAVMRAMNEYPCLEQMALLTDFADYCVGFRDTMPLSHVWHALFADSSPGAHQEAFRLLDRYPQLEKIVLSKMDSLLRKARANDDSGMLFRMLPLLSMLELEEKDAAHLTGCIFDALMVIYLKHEDTAGAQALMKLAKQQSANGRADQMWPETVKRYADVISVRKVQVQLPAEASAGQPRLPPAASAVPRLKF